MFQDLEGTGTQVYSGYGPINEILGGWNLPAASSVAGVFFIPRDVNFSFAQVYAGQDAGATYQVLVTTVEYAQNDGYDDVTDTDQVNVTVVNPASSTIIWSDVSAGFNNLAFNDLDLLAIQIRSNAAGVDIDFFGLYLRIEAS